MKRILHAVEAWMDDFKIKNKFYILYILCVLVPLIVTDSAVFSVVMKSEREAREHENAVPVTPSIDSVLESFDGSTCQCSCIQYFKYGQQCSRDREEYLYEQIY